MKVLIAGAGAIGQWLGARLQAAGHAPTLLARPQHVAAMRDGLVVHGLTSYRGTLAAVPTLAEAGSGFEAIVLTCKAHQTAALAEATAPLLAPTGVFVSLQNGLGNAQKVRRFVPADRVAIALTSQGVNLEAPGRIQHAGTGPTLVGPLDGAAPQASRSAEHLLADAGLAPQWQAAMRPFLWRKAIVNAGINPLGALYGVRNGALLDRPELWSLSQALVREAVGLAERARVALPSGDLVETVRATLTATRDNRCSMLQDVAAHRPTETEQITGRMVRLAEKLLVAMPRNESVYGRLKDLEATYLGPAAATKLAWDELPWEQEPF